MIKLKIYKRLINANAFQFTVYDFCYKKITGVLWYRGNSNVDIFYYGISFKKAWNFLMIQKLKKIFSYLNLNPSFFFMSWNVYFVFKKIIKAYFLNLNGNILLYYNLLWKKLYLYEIKLFCFNLPDFGLF